MTIAIAVLNREGAAFLSDSLCLEQRGLMGAVGASSVVPYFCPTIVDRPKFDILPGLLVAHSGSWSDAPLPRPTSTDFVAAVREYWAAVLQRRRSLPQDGDQHMLAAGGRPLKLAVFELNGSETVHAEPCVVMRGSPTQWGGENGIEALPVPETLTGAKELALDLARTYVREHYARDGKTCFADYEGSGFTPPMAPPYWLGWITPELTISTGGPFE